jgi:hypothetical protein
MHKYSAVEIKKMLEFLIDNIYVVVGGHIALVLSIGPSAVSVHFLLSGCTY